MDHLEHFKRQVRNYLFIVIVFINGMVCVSIWAGLKILHLNDVPLMIILASFIFVTALVVSVSLSRYITQPIAALWQAILHVSPDHSNTSPPNLEKLKIGRELVTSLSLQVYQLASTGTPQKTDIAASTRPQTVLSSLPLPTIVLDKDLTIVFANEAAAHYLNQPEKELVGKNAYSVLDMSFNHEYTFDKWLAKARADKLTASESWEHVKLKTPGQKELLQLDMAAYYNKNNPSGVEVIITFFDHSARYSEDDNSLTFVSLAVHELRTPLTLLRGYIEVFEEELSGKLDEELSGYLNKMQAASQQLTAFVNNILNVARVEADQLTLQLQEEKLEGIVKGAVNDLSMRAKLQKIVLECSVDPSLPTVAVDRVSISEVLINLIDNAIKYSKADQKIMVKSYLAKNGLVETIVQDSGVGISDNVLPNLFEKFYRNFKSKQQVGGTGLGLYLSKAIINAHGGNIWVQSKEGSGSTFGFTVKPYHMLAAELKTGDNKDIVRGAHGWIKNHSLYRR